jgi:hypothetical protein
MAMLMTLHSLSLLASLPQVIGPRHSFAVSKGLEAKLQSPGGTCSSSEVTWRHLKPHLCGMDAVRLTVAMLTMLCQPYTSLPFCLFHR